VKEIDFLPEWYLEGKRRKVCIRRQCLALGLIVMGMVTYNTIAARRIDTAAAALEQLEDHRIQAEDVMHRFESLSREVSEYRTKADELRRMDSRIESAAVLAEISHIIGDRIILNQLEFTAEPVAPADQNATRGNSAVRAVGTKQTSIPLGDVKFRILLAGVAANPEDVGELVCRLDESTYFRDVHSSGFRNDTIDIPESRATGSAEPEGQKSATETKRTVQVSEFKITCYLANYDETKTE
jgi:hypothetical protein